MRWLQSFLMMLVTLFHRKREKGRLDDELQFHLEQQIAENIAKGMSPEEARTAALRLFGNPTLLREEAQSTWSWNWLEKTWRDLRYGGRTLRRSPGFALVAILVMALGIGATTSLFTIVRSVMLKPLPFRDPEHLVMIYEHFRQFNAPYNVVAPGDFYDWREKTHGFQDMAAWHWGTGFNLSGEHAESPEVVAAAGGSWNLFSLLGVEPVLGRTFTSEEDQLGSGQAAILSWSLYQGRFSGDPSILGKQIRLDAKSYTVVGVLPKWFSYPNPLIKIWVPYSSTFLPEEIRANDMHQSYVVARVRKDVSAETAIKEVSALQYSIHRANASRPVAEDAVLRPMVEDVVDDARTPLIVLLGAVGCMLLIACLNVSNLLVARGSARRKEVAIRGALGGSRPTLVREQMMESLLICLLGAGIGLVLSFWATHWLATHWEDLPRTDAIHMDGVVLAFSIGLALAATLLAGLLPALSSTGKGILKGLQDSARTIGGSASRALLRKILLTAEIALTVVLLISAGLLFKSFIHLKTSNLGCATDHILTVKYALPSKQYDKPEKVAAFHETLLQRVRSLPGVSAAGLVSLPPGGGYGGDNVFTIPEHPADAPSLQFDAIFRTADPGYFNTLQIPLIQGRFFTDQERLDRRYVTIVSKKFASQFFSGENPVGKHIRMAWSGKPEVYEIVGVVGDTPFVVSEPLKAMVYFPIFSGLPDRAGEATVVVRTSGEPLSSVVSIEKQVASLDLGLPVYDVLTMPQIVEKSTVSQSFSASLVLIFATLSLLLAAVGLYGVLSYLVSQRITEIGIRMALGAPRSEVLRLVLVDGMRPVVIGLAIGLAGAAGAGMLIKSILYGTRPLDPAVFATMVVVLMFTAMAASAVPALRASRIEPTQALRSE